MVVTCSSPSIRGISEVDMLLGDPSKARQRLGWRHKIEFADLVREMVECDLALLETEGRRYDPND